MNRFTCFEKHTKMTLTKRHFKNAFNKKIKSLLGYDEYLRRHYFNDFSLKTSHQKSLGLRAIAFRKATEAYIDNLGYAGVEWFYPVKLLISFQAQGKTHVPSKIVAELNFTSESMLNIWIRKNMESEPEWTCLISGTSSLIHPMYDGIDKKTYLLEVFTPEGD